MQRMVNMTQSDPEPIDRLEKILKDSEPGGPGIRSRMTSEEMIHELALAFQELQKRMLTLLGEMNHLRSRALRKV